MPALRLVLFACLHTAVVTGYAQTLDAVKTDLWENGTGTHSVYRIPGIVVTEKGTALAYCEARNGNDWGDIRIQMRRSTDGAVTWSEAKQMAEAPGPLSRNPVLGDRARLPVITYNNPVAIPGPGSTVHLLFCVEYMRCFYQRSGDDGVTWDAPVEITESAFGGFRSAFAWKVLATGPGHGLRLRSGRLVVPVWLSKGAGSNRHGDSVSAAIYSDDDGKTWQPGGIVAQNLPDSKDLNETTGVELTDGSVLFNIRNHNPERRRLHSVSPGGAGPWTKPAAIADLYEPICFGSMLRHSWPGKENQAGLLLFSLPAPLDLPDGTIAPGNTRDRRNLAIRMSRDEGKSWPDHRILEPGPSAYSDLAVLPGGGVLCFYERTLPPAPGTEKGKAVLTVAKFRVDR